MIDQKAREIAAKASGTSGYITERETEAARLGIIEGRRQAFEEAAKVAEQRAITQRARAKPDDWPEDAWNARQVGIISHLEQAAAAIRALIE
jgi:hypothetical protein